MPALLVPQGAEERAVRAGAPQADIVVVRPGSSAAVLPEKLPAGLIVVLGLCGSLRGLRTGQCAIFSDIVDEVGRYSFDAELVRAMQKTLPDAKVVRGCTVDHVITRATERAALAAAYGAEAVDMEGTHLARALTARGRPSLIVRVVSDDPSFDLPPIEHAFAADGTLRPLQLALAFARKPQAAARFIRDVRRSLAALSVVAKLVAEPSG